MAVVRWSIYIKVVTVLLCVSWVKLCSGRLDPVYSEYTVMVETSQDRVPPAIPYQVAMVMAAGKSGPSSDIQPNMAVLVQATSTGNPVKVLHPRPAVPQPITEPFTPRLG